MINLKNGYGITSDGKSYTLIQYAIQTSKNGNVTEIQKSISFHSTLEAIDDLKKEIKAYE